MYPPENISDVNDDEEEEEEEVFREVEVEQLIDIPSTKKSLTRSLEFVLYHVIFY